MSTKADGRAWSSTRRRVAGWLVAGVALVLGSGTPASARHEGGPPPSERCVQVVDAGFGGGWYLDSTPANMTAGSTCRFDSTGHGGYEAAPGGDWRVLITRPDGSAVEYSSHLGSPTCGTWVIGPGDAVQVTATTSIAAGAGIGCR